ncbi:hypothetical protein FKM82_000633 [Ascaphus truei]
MILLITIFFTHCLYAYTNMSAYFCFLYHACRQDKIQALSEWTRTDNSDDDDNRLVYKPLASLLHSYSYNKICQLRKNSTATFYLTPFPSPPKNCIYDTVAPFTNIVGKQTYSSSLKYNLIILC